jgi:hypothetical protein
MCKEIEIIFLKHQIESGDLKIIFKNILYEQNSKFELANK